MTRPVLHNYFRSSTSHRVRIALALKGVEYGYEAFHLRKGEQHQPRYLGINPQELVRLSLGRTARYSRSPSLSSNFWMDVPKPPLLPSDALSKARVRSLAQMIALDIHPINNLRVLSYLREHFGADDEAAGHWFCHWVNEAFGPLERRLASEPQTGRYCHGDLVTLADICLAAQLASNRRFAVDINPYPTIARIANALAELPAFVKAAPENQPDRE